MAEQILDGYVVENITGLRNLGSSSDKFFRNRRELVYNSSGVGLVSEGIGIITTKGYYSAGDGGHQTYYADFSDITSSDNSGNIIVDSNGTRWKTQLKSGILKTITGNGTINYIPKFISTSGLINSLLYDNGINIGINTTTPEYNLDAKGTIFTHTGNLISSFGGIGRYQNLLTYSNDFSNSAWTKNVGVTVTPKVIIGPDGKTLADQISYTGGGVAGTFKIAQTTTTVAETGIKYISSVWLKAATGINLQFGQNIASAKGIKIIPSWQRFNTNADSISTEGSSHIFYLYSSGSDNSPFTIYAFGAQSEKSSQPNCYINTESISYSGTGYGLILTSPGPHLIKSGNLGIQLNNTNPSSALDINGQITIRGGSPGLNKVLTSDADGLAIWQNAETVSSNASGTINYIPKFISSSGISDSLIRQNANPTNGIVVEGKLQVSGAGTDILSVIGTTGNNIFSVNGDFIYMYRGADNDTTNFTRIFDSEELLFNDDYNKNSIRFRNNNRFLYDNTGIIVLDWHNKIISGAWNSNNLRLSGNLVATENLVRGLSGQLENSGQLLYSRSNPYKFVTGAGTFNYIPRFVSSSGISDSLVRQDINNANRIVIESGLMVTGNSEPSGIFSVFGKYGEIFRVNNHFIYFYSTNLGDLAPIFNTEEMLFNDSFGKSSISYGTDSRTLYSNEGFNSLNWYARLLYDGSQAIALNWSGNNRILSGNWNSNNLRLSGNLVATENLVRGLSGQLENSGQLLYPKNNPYKFVTGAGTLGYIPRFVSSSGLSNSIIYDDGTNIGIGNTNPSDYVSIGNNSQFQISQTGNIKLKGGNITNDILNDSSIVHYQDLAAFTNNSQFVTGTLRVLLPNIKNTMLNIGIVGYSYTSNTINGWESNIKGYAYENDTWYNMSAKHNGGGPFSQIRTISQSGRHCIFFGDTTTVWNYPKTIVKDVLAGYSNADKWRDGWKIDIIATETTTSGSNILNINPNFQIKDGTEGAKKQLISDTYGVVSWASPNFYPSGQNPSGYYQSSNPYKFITGLGISGYIPKFISNSGVTSSELYERGGHFSIGAGAPIIGGDGFLGQAKLYIIDDINTNGALPTGIASTNAGVVISSSDIDYLHLNLGTYLDIGFDHVYCYIQSQDKYNPSLNRLVLNPVTGAIGINNRDPHASLDISGQIAIRGGGYGLNKVLTSDADGLATWQNSSSSSVSASGASNYLAKFNSQSGLINSIIYETSSKIGIDNLFPYEKLDISGNLRLSNSGILKLYSSGNLLFGTVYENNSGKIEINSSSGVLLLSDQGSAKNPIANFTSLSGLEVGRTISSNIGNKTLKEKDSRKVFTNEGSSSLNTYNLPPASSGLDYIFMLENAGSLKVQTAGTNIIRIGDLVTTAGGYVVSSGIGSSLEIIGINASAYVALSYLGSWQLN